MSDIDFALRTLTSAVDKDCTYDQLRKVCSFMYTSRNFPDIKEQDLAALPGYDVSADFDTYVRYEWLIDRRPSQHFDVIVPADLVGPDIRIISDRNTFVDRNRNTGTIREVVQFIMVGVSMGYYHFPLAHVDYRKDHLVRTRKVTPNSPPDMSYLIGLIMLIEGLFAVSPAFPFDINFEDRSIMNPFIRAIFPLSTVDEVMKSLYPLTDDTVVETDLSTNNQIVDDYEIPIQIIDPLQTPSARRIDGPGEYKAFMLRGEKEEDTGDILDIGARLNLHELSISSSDTEDEEGE